MGLSTESGLRSRAGFPVFKAVERWISKIPKKSLKNPENPLYSIRLSNLLNDDLYYHSTQYKVQIRLKPTILGRGE